MKRPLIVGVRPPGSSVYRFRIFGQRENAFPPAELYATLHGLAQWLTHGHNPARDENEPAVRALRLV
jgi:hypothetical protein